MDNLHYKNDVQTIELIQNPNNSNEIIFLDKNNDNIITDDCGGSFQPLKEETKIVDVLFHPTEKKIILAQDKDDNLLLSEDSGKTWT